MKDMTVETLNFIILCMGLLFVMAGILLIVGKLAGKRPAFPSGLRFKAGERSRPDGFYPFPSDIRREPSAGPFSVPFLFVYLLDGRSGGRPSHFSSGGFP